MEARAMQNWQPFDGLWIELELADAVSLDPYLKEDPESLDRLKRALHAPTHALVWEDPKQPRHVTYFFSDPRLPWPRSGRSFSVYGPSTDFLFDFRVDGSLASVEVRRHRNRMLP